MSTLLSLLRKHPPTHANTHSCAPPPHTYTRTRKKWNALLTFIRDDDCYAARHPGDAKDPFFYKARFLWRSSGDVAVEFEKPEGISLVVKIIPERFVVHPNDAVFVEWEGYAIPYRFFFFLLATPFLITFHPLQDRKSVV